MIEIETQLAPMVNTEMTVPGPVSIATRLA